MSEVPYEERRLHLDEMSRLLREVEEDLFDAAPMDLTAKHLAEMEESCRDFRTRFLRADTVPRLKHVECRMFQPGVDRYLELGWLNGYAALRIVANDLEEGCILLTNDDAQHFGTHLMHPPAVPLAHQEGERK